MLRYGEGRLLLRREVLLLREFKAIINQLSRGQSHDLLRLKFQF